MSDELKKLEAAGFLVEPVDGGAKINGTLVYMKDGQLVLATARSAFHRQINSALGRNNPTMPGTSDKS